MADDGNIASLFWSANLQNVQASQIGNMSFVNLWPVNNELRRVIESFVELDSKFLRKLAMFVTRTHVWHVLEALIDLGAIRVSIRCSSGKSLLHLACTLDSYDGVRLLITRGADACATDDSGELPIWYARDFEIIRLVSSAMKQNPNLPKNFKPHSSSSAVKKGTSGEEAIQKLEIEALFSLVKSSGKRFPFEDIVMKIKTFDSKSWMTFKDDASGDTLLHAAVRAGLVAVPLILHLVQKYHFDVNALNANGESALIIALRQGWLNIVDLLIVCCGADVNRPGSDGLAPIHVACIVDFPDALLLLLRRGAQISSAFGKFSDDGPQVGSACRAIIRQAKVDRFNLLVNMSTNKRLTSSSINKSKVGDVALCFGDFELIGDGGASLLMFDSVLLNETLLSAALHVIAKGSLNAKWTSMVLDARHPETGKTPLIIAVCLGNVDIVRSLLAAGANPAISDKEELLPVHHALMSSNMTVVGALFDNDNGLIGFQKSFQLVTDRQEVRAIVDEAFLRRQERIVRPLLVDAALRRSTDKLNDRLEPRDILDFSATQQDTSEVMTDSPIFLAVQNGAIEVVKFFVERGVNISCEQLVTGDSVLHVAIRCSDMAMTDYLLQLEVSRDFLEHINCSGMSALHIAALTGQIDLVDRLLAAGASPVLDEAAGFPAITSSYQSIQLRLDKNRRDRSSVVFDMLKLCSKESAEIRAAREKQSGRGDRNKITGASSLFASTVVAKSAGKSNDTPQAASSISKLLTSSFSSKLSSSSVRPSSSSSTVTNNKQTTSKPTSLVNSAALRRRLSSELPSLIKIYDFYLYDFNGEPLLTAAVRQNTVTLVEQLVLFYRQMSNEFRLAAERRILVGRDGKGDMLSNHDKVSKRTELIHPCLLKSPRNGATALHVAVQLYDNRELTHILASACGAALHIPDGEGLTPVQLAVHLSRRRAASTLLRFPTVDLDCRTPDGRSLDDLATHDRIRARLQYVRQKRLELLDDDSDNSISSNSTAAGSGKLRNQRPNEDGLLSSLSIDEEIQSTGQRDGVSRKQLRQLYGRLDFVEVAAKYKEIQRKFAADIGPV